ncbi:aldo/keto reductase [Actinocorallia sp. API 0066]|uniref:aldo/keto reductase n=1 Tax=Actinocorallia sp. API 0066 TaxID=2896846 RepID=UPI001E4EDA8D|nr:aldo/keto reductase [Actinocorallia sp. API 0066]MCD0449957.1 aldo/keto reductase [Actinocorallia sp. API 0066]
MSLKPIGISDLLVSPLNLGGNVFGWTADEATSFAILDAYAAAGGNFIDTADSYSAWLPGHSGGESEGIIGRWTAARGNRDDIVIATKVGRHPQFTGLRPQTIRAAAEASLTRLGTDRIDLYYTHYDDETVPVEDIITALDELVREGKVRQIAVSNISPERLRASLEFSDRAGLAKYVAIQPHYNLVSRDTYEGERAALAAEHGLSALPYFALAAGFLTGKYRPGGPAVDSPRAAGAEKLLQDPRAVRVLTQVEEIAGTHGVSPVEVSLAWLAAQPTVLAPIASARTLRQLTPLLAFPDVKLSDEDLAALTAASTP